MAATLIDRAIDAIEEYLHEPTPREQLNKSTRDLDRATRRLERQRAECDRRERAAIRALREKGRAGAPRQHLRASAMNVERVRASARRIETGMGMLEGVRARLVGAATGAEMAEILRDASRAVSAVTLGAANPRGLAEAAARYGRANMQLDAFADMADDVADGDEELGEAADETADQILAELHVAGEAELPEVPRTEPAARADGGAATVEPLEERFRRLRGGP